jgi:hypothetical protein
MASNTNNNENNNNNSNYDDTKPWLGVVKKEMNDETSLLGMVRKKPLSYFDALTRNYLQDTQKFQVNLGQFPHNFVVVAGSSSKVKLLHGLLNVNLDPDSDAASAVVGIYGANKVAPFKAISASGAVQALVPPRKPTRQPSSIQFSLVTSAEGFKDLVGGEDGAVIDDLAKLPNSHFIHPQVFLDLEGKRDWESSELGFKLISLYEEKDEDDQEEESTDDDVIRDFDEIFQLLTFLWAVSKQAGKEVTLKEIPESGIITSICEKKSLALTAGRAGIVEGPQSQQGAAQIATAAESRRLTEAMVLNLTKSNEAYARQITKDDSTKSALSRLAPDQAALFHLLNTDDFDEDGTPELNEFTTKLTENRDPRRAINMVRQETRSWGGSISDKSLLQFLSSGYLAPDINQEPDGMTCLGFVPHHERHKFEDKHHAAADNMRSMFGEKTFDEDSIKRYTKKQFFLPNRIEDWVTQLHSTARFIDLLTCDESVGSEAYRTALVLYEQNEQTFRSTFQQDKTMGIKILYFLDRVFQDFATELSQYAGRTDPLRLASRSLKQRQRNTVIQTLGPLKYGITPSISLPPGLVNIHGTVVGGLSSEFQDAPGAGDEGGTGRLMTVTLPTGWKIPFGKGFGTYFNPRNEGNRGNLDGWPATTHDITGEQKPMCVRLMVTGKCNKENCRLSHVKPTALGRTTMDTITTRLAGIYQRV